MCDPIDMPGFEASADRSALGFEAAVGRYFAFLEDWGYEVAKAGSTFVRFERTPLFVNVFHGRGSYELGAEVGRTTVRHGEPVEQSFPIGYLATVIGGTAQEAYRTRTATTAAQVDRFVAELGQWLEAYGEQALEGDEATFEALSEAVAKESTRQMDTMRATELRRRADEAWRARDYATVVQAYDEIDRELITVSLRAFEEGRLVYARKALER